MSEQFSPRAERGIGDLKRAFQDHIGIPYPVTAESDNEVRARIEDLLKQSKEDARDAVREWERERDEGLPYPAK